MLYNTSRNTHCPVLEELAERIPAAEAVGSTLAVVVADTLVVDSTLAVDDGPLLELYCFM